MTMTYLKAADFTEAILRMAVLRRCTAKNAIFYKADLTGANVRQGEFLGALFNEAILEEVKHAESANFFGTWLPEEDQSTITHIPV
jgi:uncharacterized protein YjbI with pentapeptide repeats